MSARRKIFGKPLLCPHPLSSGTTFDVSFWGSTSSVNCTTLGPSSKSLEPTANKSRTFLVGYNQLIRALLEEEIVERILTEKRKKINDQLDIFMQQFTEKQLKKLELEVKIENIIKQKLLQQIIQELQIVNRQLSSIVLNVHVINQVNVLGDLLAAPANKLYLKNLTLLSDQETYDRLERVLENCKIVSSLMLKNAGDLDVLSRLSSAIEVLNAKIITAENYCSLLELNQEIVLRANLKDASNILSDI